MMIKTLFELKLSKMTRLELTLDVRVFGVGFRVAFLDHFFMIRLRFVLLELAFYYFYGKLEEKNDKS